METDSKGRETVGQLIEKGVRILNPVTVHVDPDVDPELISGEGVLIYPGCRLAGSKTVVSAGCILGEEGPATVVDCQLGRGVRLKGGFFRGSVFLEKASMGLGAQVREGCLLEEQASGAHCVGLKQTILFPFVTLGSLINFCDCLLAGGTSRRAHSEVGSSYIHFNFTPDGDKATASLFGDVPRGVMLNQPPIFLGGQGGAVGPLHLGFGTVVAAGGILREDAPADGRFIVPGMPASLAKDVRLLKRRGFRRILENNLLYIANLVALEEWYRYVRRPFFAAEDLGVFVWRGALDVLARAREERVRRLCEFAAVVKTADGPAAPAEAAVQAACAVFREHPPGAGREEFLAAMGPVLEIVSASGGSYVQTIQSLPPETVALGIAWLQGVVADLCSAAGARAPELGLWSGAGRGKDGKTLRD